MAAVRIDVAQFSGFEQPKGAYTVGIMPSSAEYSTAIEPPAVTTQELAHDL